MTAQQQRRQPRKWRIVAALTAGSLLLASMLILVLSAVPPGAHTLTLTNRSSSCVQDIVVLIPHKTGCTAHYAGALSSGECRTLVLPVDGEGNSSVYWRVPGRATGYWDCVDDYQTRYAQTAATFEFTDREQNKHAGNCRSRRCGSDSDAATGSIPQRGGVV